jgi:hypothetical protein
MPASVIAKCRCVEKADTASPYGKPGDPTQTRVRLAPVQGDENKTWTQWTPGGSIELSITNPAAIEAFKVGQDYLVTFTSVPAEG